MSGSSIVEQGKKTNQSLVSYRHFLLLLELHSTIDLLLVAVLLELQVAPLDWREDGSLGKIVRFMHVHIQSPRNSRG